MALATVDEDGFPNVRMVLLKGFDERGFVFYTNTNSPKGRELDAAAKAAAVFHWKSLKRQVRVRGTGRTGVRRGGRRLFRHPRQGLADRGLGEPAVDAAPGAGSPSKRRSPSTPPNTRSAPCRGRPTGAATGSCRWRWNSGRTGRSGCTSASQFRRDRVAAPWSKTRLYP